MKTKKIIIIVYYNFAAWEAPKINIYRLIYILPDTDSWEWTEIVIGFKVLLCIEICLFYNHLKEIIGDEQFHKSDNTIGKFNVWTTWTRKRGMVYRQRCFFPHLPFIAFDWNLLSSAAPCSDTSATSSTQGKWWSHIFWFVFLYFPYIMRQNEGNKKKFVYLLLWRRRIFGARRLITHRLVVLIQINTTVEWLQDKNSLRKNVH